MRLTTNNVAELKALNRLFGDVFNDSQNYHELLPNEKYLYDFLSDENHIVLIAERDGVVVGGLVAYVLTKFERERKEVYVYDLAVASNRQRQGIGRQLIDEVKTVAASCGAYTVFVQADEGDEAVKFYESLSPSENLRTRSFDFDV